MQELNLNETIFSKIGRFCMSYCTKCAAKDPEMMAIVECWLPLARSSSFLPSLPWMSCLSWRQLGRTNSNAKIVHGSFLVVSCQNDLGAAIHFQARLHQLFHQKCSHKYCTIMLGCLQQKIRKSLETLRCNLMKWKIDFNLSSLRYLDYKYK